MAIDVKWRDLYNLGCKHQLEMIELFSGERWFSLASSVDIPEGVDIGCEVISNDELIKRRDGLRNSASSDASVGIRDDILKRCVDSLDKDPMDCI